MIIFKNSSRDMYLINSPLESQKEIRIKSLIVFDDPRIIYYKWRMAWRSREKANNILVKQKRYNELLRLSSRNNDTSSFAHGTLKIIYNSGRLIVTINSLEDTGEGEVFSRDRSFHLLREITLIHCWITNI